MSRPLRAGGLALLGVAMVAAVIGTATALGGGDDEPPAQQQADPTTSVDAGDTDDPADGSPEPKEPPTETSSPAGEPTTSKTTSPRPATSTPGSPGDGSGNGGDSDGDGKDGDQVKSVSVRVYNNSKISGLASRASDDLRAAGWNVVDTDNYSGGRIHATTAYYSPGTKEKAAAEAIGADFGMRVEPRFDGIADSSPGVIVIVTKDYSGSK